MSVKSLLLWEKWRPKAMDDIILLPRIRKHFESGLNQNFIFHGHYGTGKTTLARILIGRYTKNSPYLELNSSLYTSIDILRSDIEDFCKFMPMLESDYTYKYVFLDEFERVSIQFQDAFKAFIEKYSKENIRFIITTNHLNKISDGIKSRIPSIDFDCQNIEEEKYLKKEIYKRITSKILPAEGKEIPKEDLIYIINKKFPDFRSILVEVQNYIKTGSISNEVSNISNKIKFDLYNMLFDESYDYEKIHHFLMSNFGAEKIDIMIKLLGSSFINWCISEKSIKSDKLFKCNYIIADYSDKLENSIDPLILGITIVGKFRDILL